MLNHGTGYTLETVRGMMVMDRRWHVTRLLKKINAENEAIRRSTKGKT